MILDLYQHTFYWLESRPERHSDDHLNQKVLQTRHLHSGPRQGFQPPGDCLENNVVTDVLTTKVLISSW